MPTLKRLAALATILAVAIVASACASSGAPGSPAASGEPSAAASPSAESSGSPEASASGSAEASASAAASAGAGGDDLASKIPETVGDVTLSATVVDGEAYVRANVNRQLAPILTALNKAPTDVTVASATGAATGGQSLFIDAVQITGADATAVTTAFQTAAAATPGTTVETADVGGKSVLKATTTSYTLALYASGDTLFYVQSPDPALVDQAIQALP